MPAKSEIDYERSDASPRRIAGAAAALVGLIALVIGGLLFAFKGATDDRIKAPGAPFARAPRLQIDDTMQEAALRRGQTERLGSAGVEGGSRRIPIEEAMRRVAAGAEPTRSWP